MLLKNKLQAFFIPFGLCYFLIVVIINVTALSTINLDKNWLLYSSYFFFNISLIYLLDRKKFSSKLFLQIVLICLLFLMIDTYIAFIPAAIKVLITISSLIFLVKFIFKDKDLKTESIQHKEIINKNELLWLFFLTVIGFLIRIYRAGNLSFWVDEYYHVFAGKSLLTTGLPLLPNFTTYFRAFLYTELNTLFYSLFGVSELTSRIAPALLGTLVIPCIYFLGRKIFNSRKFAWLCAVIITFSDFAIFYSRYNRFYIALSFFVILNIVFFWKVVFENQKKNFLSLLLFSAVLIPGFDSKSSIFLFLCTPLAILIEKKQWKNIYLWLYTGISIASYLFFSFIEKISSISDTPLAPKVAINLPISIPNSILSIIYPHFDLFFANFLYRYFIIIFIFLNIGLILCIKTYVKGDLISKIKLFILTYTITSFILISKFFINIKNYTWDQRHISFLFALLILSSVIILEEIVKRIETKDGRLTKITIVIFTFSIINIIGIYKVLYIKYGDSFINTRYLAMTAEPYRADYKTPYEFVNENYKEGDVIIGDNFMFLGDLYLNDPMNYTFQNDDVSEIERIIQRNNRVWIIDTTYDMKKFHAKYRWGNIYKFLQTNEDKIVYYGQDSKTRVFMFNK